MAGADTIMTTTLPTIIGMGVVSKSTDTMFGKGKRGTSQRTTRTARTKTKVGVRKVHTGKRGGKYVMKKGRRVYI